MSEEVEKKLPYSITKNSIFINFEDNRFQYINLDNVLIIEADYETNNIEVIFNNEQSIDLELDTTERAKEFMDTFFKIKHE